MDRQKLLNLLTITKPAISTSAASIECFRYFLFHDDKITTWNDRIGITLPNESLSDKESFTGAVESSVLLAFLEKHRANDVNFKVLGDGHVQLSSKKGRSKFVAKYLEQDEYVLDEEVHADVEGPTVEISDQFIEGLELCLLCSAKIEASAYIMGVNFDTEDNCMWATDLHKMSKFPLSDSINCDSFIMSAEFAETLLTLAKQYKDVKGELSIDTDANIIRCVFSDCSLVGRLIDASTEDPLTYNSIIADSLGSGYVDDFIDIPKGFYEAVDRQVFIASSSKHTHGTELSIRKGKLEMFTDTGVETGEEKLNISKDHPDVELVIDASFILPGIKYCDEILVQDSVVAMRGVNGYEYVTSHSND